MDLDLKGGCQVGEGRRVARCRSGVVKGGEWRRPGEPEDRSWFARGDANADADDGDDFDFDFDFDFDLDDFDDAANVIVIVIVKANESENVGGGGGDVLPYSRYTGPSINHCAHQPH
ncbi:hypothetical protein HZH66_012753 [Vespula vulgaris]|uniref:Uncharacterized protein n=1 Tax=Vespula vulgaris TaxID=7454 RepID=A0A834MUE9_VESVU|nr:hypothetical protein HZH66_012753 [Vespula vulgaris]